jgi:hypothetical protein
MLPTWGLMDHETAELVVPVTRGEKVALWPPVRDATPGERLMPTGSRTTETDATFVVFATLVAVTMIVCCEVTLLGAV